MIKRKEIINRITDGFKVVAFEYVLKELQGPYGEEVEQRFWFEKVEQSLVEGDKPIYKVFTIISGKVYQEVYEMPKRNMDLELVVATGLNVLRATLQKELEYKEILSYRIAETTTGI